MTVYNVTNAATLATAYAACAAGDSIIGAAGNYGVFNPTRVFAAPGITIASVDPAAPMIISGMSANNAKGHAFQNVKFRYAFQTGDSAELHVFEVVGASERFKFLYCQFECTFNATGYPTGVPLYFQGSGMPSNNKTHEIRGCSIHGFMRLIVVLECDDIKIYGNDMYDCGSDGLNFVASSNLRFEGNKLHDFRMDAAIGGHGDFLQIYNLGQAYDSKDIWVLRNQFLVGNGSFTQSCFAGNEQVNAGNSGRRYANWHFEDNWFKVAHTNAIAISACDVLTVKNNNIFWAPLNMADPANATDVPTSGGVLAPVFVPRVFILGCTGAVVTGNRCWDAPHSSGTRFDFSGSTGTFNDNLTDNTSGSGPALPPFILGDDGTGALLPQIAGGVTVHAVVGP